MFSCDFQNKMDTSHTLNFAHKWIINNFYSLYDKSTWKPSFLVSDNFSPLARDTLDAYIELCSLDKDGYLSMFLCIDAAAHNLIDLTVIYKLAIHDGNGETFCCKESQSSFTSTARLGWKKYIKVEHLLNDENEVLLRNKLTVFCKVSILMPKSFPLQVQQTPRITRSFYDTQTVLAPFHIKWTVDNLTKFQNKENILFYPVDSDTFSANNEEMKFHLRLYPLSENNQLKIMLLFKSKVVYKINIQVRLTLVSERKEIFVMSCHDHLTSKGCFSWLVPLMRENRNSQTCIFCEAYINENLKIPVEKDFIVQLNKNLNTAITGFSAVTKIWKSYFDAKTDVKLESNYEESCQLLTKIPLVESYFNGNPRILDTVIHTWAIHEYSDFLDVNKSRKVLESDKFQSLRNTNLTFRLRLCPQSQSDHSCAVYLVYCNSKREHIQVQLFISVIDENGEKKNCKVLRHTFGENTNPFFKEDYLGLFFFENDMLDQNEAFLPENTLTVYCEVQIIDDQDSRRKSTDNLDDKQFEPNESDPLLIKK